MVAEHFGITHTEAELLPLCHTTLDGTTPDGLADAARQLGLSAVITYDEPTVLAESLQRQQPLIVFLGISSASSLEIHSVVVISYEQQSVTFIDPLDGAEHSQLRSNFFAQWEAAFYVAILIGHS
jgi:ABC-type bacteriocin/lantibiotic exporter with double-glycine peptidase domain